MEQDIYFKQRKLFNPHEHNFKVFVYGAGSIGSHVVVGLAKIGIKDITVYDYDIVEWDNIPAQFYSTPEFGETHVLKIEALSYITKHMTGTEIKTKNVKVDNSFQPDLSHNSIHIIAFDNIEGRKILVEKLDGFPVHIIDGRIGGFNFEKYYMYSDVTDEYKATLEGVFSELECGEKCLWMVNAMISSKIISDVVKISKGEKPNFMMKGNAMSDIIISR